MAKAKQNDEPKAAPTGGTRLYRVSGKMSQFKEKNPETGQREIVAVYGDQIELTPERAAQLGRDVVIPAEEWDTQVKAEAKKRRAGAIAQTRNGEDDE